MSAAVFPNVRQQALANINSYLMQGKPVFFNPENPTYRYYITQGIHLGSITNFSKQELIFVSVGYFNLCFSIKPERILQFILFKRSVAKWSG